MKTKTLKSLLLGVLITFIYSSVFAKGISCRDLLEIKGTVQTNKAAAVAKDYEALEVIASLVLALQIQAKKGIPIIGKVKPSNYKSIPRIEYNKRMEYSFDTYNFKNISKADKAAIINDLPRMVEQILKKSHNLGKEFHTKFEKEFTKDLLIRNKIWFKEFFEENFKAIVFNAAKMPKLPLKEKLFLFIQRSSKTLIPISLITGGLLELIYPSMLFDKFYQDGLQASIDYLFITKTGINAVPLYLGLSPLQIKNIVSGKERLNFLEYDFEAGRSIRKDYVDVTLEN